MDSRLDHTTERRELARSLLQSTGVEVHPEEFTVVSVTRDQWERLLSDASLSPSGTVPFMIFSDQHEITLVLARGDFERIRRALGESKCERGFRLVTFTALMDFSVVGFLASVSALLADSGIPILALSSFSRDHVLIKQEDLAAALKALGPNVADLC